MQSTYLPCLSRDYTVLPPHPSDTLSFPPATYGSTNTSTNTEWEGSPHLLESSIFGARTNLLHRSCTAPAASKQAAVALQPSLLSSKFLPYLA